MWDWAGTPDSCTWHSCHADYLEIGAVAIEIQPKVLLDWIFAIEKLVDEVFIDDRYVRGGLRIALHARHAAHFLTRQTPRFGFGDAAPHPLLNRCLKGGAQLFLELCLLAVLRNMCLDTRDQPIPPQHHCLLMPREFEPLRLPGVPMHGFHLSVPFCQGW
jgi:hypothetical protein